MCLFGFNFRELLGEWDSKGFEVKSEIVDNAKSGFLLTNDSAKIYYEDTENSGDTLFFIYGLGCSISHWKYQIRFFRDQALSAKVKSKKYRIVWMDYRGHGKSSIGESKEISLERFVEDIYQLCEHLKISNATFLGQSMGGTVALKLADIHPSLVKKLVLQGSPPVAPSKTINAGAIVPHVWKNMIRINKLSPAIIRLMYSGLPSISRPIMEAIRFLGFNPKLVNVEDVKEYTSALLAANPNVFWDLAEDMESFDVAGFDSKIMVPTLILAGALDNCVPMDQIKYLENELPNSQIELIPHGSHCPHLDDPSLVNEIINDFILKN